MANPDSLNPAFRGAFNMIMKEVNIPFVESIIPEIRVKRLVKYQHDYDFWLVYVLGIIEGNVMQLFKSQYNREPTNDERFEIEEITQLYLKQIKEILAKNLKHTLEE